MSNNKGLYKPWFVDKEGKRKRSSTWWISYYCNGCPTHPKGHGRHREPTKTESITEARLKLDRARGLLSEGKPVIKVNEIMMGELLQGVLDDAEIRCKKSTWMVYRDSVKVHLEPFFSSHRAVDLCYNESLVRTFVLQKKKAGYAEASINSMLTLLIRAFSLARNRIALIPRITKFKLNNARKGFFTRAEFETLCTNLPDDVRRPIEVMFITGWRSWSEVFSRQRRHVMWKEGKIILDPGEAKNSEPRIFPMTSRLREILEEQESVTLALEKEKGILIPWLFHHDGQPMAKFYEHRGQWKPQRYFLRSWKAALKASGLVGRIRHDFRRSAIREFGAHGVSDDIGMELAGHKTHKIYKQYKAIREADLFEEAKKLDSRTERTEKWKGN